MRMRAEEQVTEFMGCYRSQQTRQVNAEGAARVLDSIKKDVAILAGSIFIQKGQAKN
jgi:hypothetical protein